MSKILLTAISILLSIKLSYANENKDKEDIKNHKNMTNKENTQTNNKK